MDTPGKLTVSDQAAAVVIICLLYFGGYSLVVFTIAPVQRMLEHSPLYGSLVFVPHGIRVLVVWLYGTRGAVFLMPACLLTALAFPPQAGLTPCSLFFYFSGAVATAVAFCVVRRGSPRTLPVNGGATSWRDLFLVGAFAAALNGLALFSLKSDGSIADFSTIFIGDLLGLLVMMLLLMLGFKAVRAMGRKTP